MKPIKTQERYFASSRISVVHQDGTQLTPGATGVFVHLHTREDEETPCSAEIFDDSGDYHAEIGLEWDGKTLVGYDGVFDVPEEVLTMLKENGFTISL